MSSSQLVGGGLLRLNRWNRRCFVGYQGSNTSEQSLLPLKLFNVYRKPALVANLLACPIWTLLQVAKNMPMFFILPSLPNTFLCPLPQLLQALLKFLIFLIFLLRCPSFVFGVQSLRRAPLLPCKLLNLISKKKHHVCVGGFVGISFQEMG